MRDADNTLEHGTVHSVRVEPSCTVIETPSHRSLSWAVRRAGEKLEERCGGRGVCGGCRISVVHGSVSDPTASELRLLNNEERARGVRLACQARATDDLTVRVEPPVLHGEHRILTAASLGIRSVAPLVTSYDVRVREPSLQDLRGDDLRVAEELRTGPGRDCRSVDPGCSLRLSEQIRSEHGRFQVVVGGHEIIGINRFGASLLGMAIDLGTTGTAAYLCDLHEGKIVAAGGMPNPQISYGEDIITRIDGAVRSSERALDLKTAAVHVLGRLVHDLTSRVECAADQVADMVVVGNTAMHHLLLGLPLRQLARAPHVPAVALEMNVKARDLGMEVMPGAFVFLPPNPAAFVGSDHLAMLLAAGAQEAKKPTLFVDIGTNTEICLASADGLMSVSCASGPAFEGMHVSCGVGAVGGAIERVVLTDEGAVFATIDHGKPIGLCGSGIVDLCSELLRLGVIEPSGEFRMGNGQVRAGDSGVGFAVLEEGEGGANRPIIFTQRDVRSVQLAKAAIQTGTAILLQSAGLRAAHLDSVVVAGAFGNYLNIRSALRLGLLPSVPPERIVQVGNAAGMGAAMMLLSAAAREQAVELSRKLTYLELAAHPDFKKLFMKSIKFSPEGE